MVFVILGLGLASARAARFQTPSRDVLKNASGFSSRPNGDTSCPFDGESDGEAEKHWPLAKGWGVRWPEAGRDRAGLGHLFTS